MALIKSISWLKYMTNQVATTPKKHNNIWGLEENMQIHVDFKLDSEIWSTLYMYSTV